MEEESARANNHIAACDQSVDETGSKENERSVCEVKNNDLETGVCESRKGRWWRKQIKREKWCLVMSFGGKVLSVSLWVCLSKFLFPHYLKGHWFCLQIYLKMFLNSKSEFSFCKSSSIKNSVFVRVGQFRNDSNIPSDNLFGSEETMDQNIPNNY